MVLSITPLAFSLALLTTLVTADQPTVYLIRHGEKPSSGNGLTSQGEERAQCLVNVFSPQTEYNIGHIMAETPESGKHPLDERDRHNHEATTNEPMC